MALSSKASALYKSKTPGLNPVLYLLALAQEDGVFKTQDGQLDLDDLPQQEDGTPVELYVQDFKLNLPVLRSFNNQDGVVTVDPVRGWQQADALRLLPRISQVAGFVSKSKIPISSRHFLSFLC